MSHFAKLDENNVVVFVTVGRLEDDGREQELFERTGDVYRQTSYNTRGGVHYTDGNPVRTSRRRSVTTTLASVTPSILTREPMGRSFHLSHSILGF